MLDAVLLKVNGYTINYVKLTTWWVLIWVKFDPIQEIGAKVGGGRSFEGGYSFTGLQYMETSNKYINFTESHPHTMIQWSAAHLHLQALPQLKYVTKAGEDLGNKSTVAHSACIFGPIDNFTVSKRTLMRCNCYVTSHPEYTSCSTWSTFTMKSVLNISEFKIRALASCTVFSNKTIANQLSAHL